ncbi:MAG: type I methionyl aminopeptidase [Candidatus Kaelpia aquatica]|nr:type I methionyl aminopeptidase [Candidatus Kaelpia aquatica]
MTIPIKSKEEIEGVKMACEKTASIMKRLSRKIEPGITTDSLNSAAERLIIESHCKPAFKGYMGYPKSICTSINSEVVHGVPGLDCVLTEGDILSLDLGVIYKGFYGDMAVTFAVGEISTEAEMLIRTTKEALCVGISSAVSGNTLGDISSAIQRYVEDRGYSIVRKFVGHGIGRELHEEPEIPNFGSPGTGPYLENGMILALEPMVNDGDYRVNILEDGWTAVTEDGSLSAHFEHTILIWGSKPQVLTEF